MLINATHRAVAVANSPAVRQRAGEVAGAGVAAAQGVGGQVSTPHLQVPELVGQGSRLVGSVIRAANDTAPLVLEVTHTLDTM